MLAAFAAIRESETLAIDRAPEVRVEPRPVVEGDRVVLADHLVNAWASEGVRFLRDVELPRLLALAPAAGSVPELFEAYNRSGPETRLPDFLGALSVCLAKGLARQRRC